MELVRDITAIQREFIERLSASFLISREKYGLCFGSVDFYFPFGKILFHFPERRLEPFEDSLSLTCIR